MIKLSLIYSLFEYFYVSLSRWIRVLRFILPFWSLGCILIAVLTFSFNTWSTVQMYIFKPYENSFILNSNVWPNNQSCCYIDGGNALIHFWSIELKSICSIIQFNWIPKHYLCNAVIFFTLCKQIWIVWYCKLVFCEKK